MTKKRWVYVIIYSVVLALMLAASTLLVVSILRLQMIPNLYVAALIAILLLLMGGTGVLLFVHRKGKWIGVARQIIACLLAAVTIAGCVFLWPKVAALRKTVETIVQNETPGTVRTVFVPVNDPAQSGADLAGYTFGALDSDAACAQQVIAALEKELNTSLTLVTFADESLLITAYQNGEVHALILNEGLLPIWEANPLYVDFLTNNKAVYTAPVQEQAQATTGETTDTPVVVVPEPQPEPEPEPVADITNTPFLVYVSGMDGYSKQLRNTRSDVNILMAVNPVDKQILLVSTPRDYYVVHPWGSGGRDKLTHCGVYGIQCSIDAMQNLYGVTVNYFMQINFTGVETMVDAIGGVTVYSDHAFTCGDFRDVYIQAGENYLNGKQALAFARDRYNQPGGDNGRGKNQMKVISAMINKVSNASVIIKNYANILKSLEGMLATNVPAQDINKLVKMQLSDMAQWDILTYAVTGYGGTQTTYSMPGTASYVMYPNQDTVDHGSALLQRVLNGEKITTADLTVPGSN